MKSGMFQQNSNLSYLYDNDPSYVCYTIQSDHLTASISMNPHDAMVSCFVETVDSQEALNQFDRFLKETNGGKIMIHLPNDCPFQYPSAFVHPDAVYFSTANLLNRENQGFSGEILGPYTVLQHPEDYAGKFEELFLFKKTHAGFVTSEKIADGLYSSLAEERKVNHPHVRHFSLLDNQGQFIATTMVHIDRGWAYISDIIVHTDMQQQHIATALLEYVFQNIYDAHPEIAHSWVIAGGAGKEEVGSRLKTRFGAIPLDQAQYQQHKIAIAFSTPGPLLQRAKGFDVPIEVLDYTIEDQTYRKQALCPESR